MKHILVLAAILCVGCATTEPAGDAAKAAEPLTADEIIAKAQKQGYKLVDEDGKELLCKKSYRTGTRVKADLVCMTPQQWKDMQDTAEQQANTIRNSTVAPITQ